MHCYSITQGQHATTQFALVSEAISASAIKSVKHKQEISFYLNGRHEGHFSVAVVSIKQSVFFRFLVDRLGWDSHGGTVMHCGVHTEPSPIVLERLHSSLRFYNRPFGWQLTNVSPSWQAPGCVGHYVVMEACVCVWTQLNSFGGSFTTWSFCVDKVIICNTLADDRFKKAPS